MKEQLTAYINATIEVKQEELEKILSFFHPLKAKKREILLNIGHTSQRTFFVGKGCLRILYLNEDGLEATRYFAFENQFATALTSFISGIPSDESIQSIEDTELFYISHTDFYNLLQTVPQWEKFYRKYLEIAYVTNTRRLMSFITLDAKERYSELLRQNPVVVRRLPNKMVASYLNISQETLSRLKVKKMSQK